MMIRAEMDWLICFLFTLVRCNVHHLSLPLDIKNLTNLLLGFKEQWTNGFGGESRSIYKVPGPTRETAFAQTITIGEVKPQPFPGGAPYFRSAPSYECGLVGEFAKTLSAPEAVIEIRR
jgi:hypothetical protein